MNIVCIGAHPDDAEFSAGGSMILWARGGHRVVALSVTRGDIGHHEMEADALALRREQECQAAASLGGYIAENLGVHDGHVTPAIELREAIVRALRCYEADIVLTHRPWDYHPDHRYSAMAVQDAAYMVMVPKFCPDSPPLRRNPLFLYMADRFTKPIPFKPDIAVDVSGVIHEKFAVIDAMVSQVYEWLPWIDGDTAMVPREPTARRAWLARKYGRLFKWPADAFRDALTEWYGEAGATVEYAEAFEVCEYGRQPTREELEALVPFARGDRR